MHPLTMVHSVSIFFDRLLRGGRKEEKRADSPSVQAAPAIIARHWENICQQNISAREVINFLQPLADLEGLAVSYPTATDWQSLAGFSEALETDRKTRHSRSHARGEAGYLEPDYQKSLCSIMEAVDLYLHCELDHDHERADPALARQFLEDRIRDELRSCSKVNSVK